MEEERKSPWAKLNWNTRSLFYYQNYYGERSTSLGEYLKKIIYLIAWDNTAHCDLYAKC